MSGRSKRRHGDSPVVDVADVFADDALVDALLSESGGSGSGSATPGFGGQEFGGQEFSGGTSGGDPLIELFDIWRDEISAAPLPPVPAIRHASHIVPAGRHRQQRTARPAMFIAVAICALLIGSAAVGSRTARPGEALWPLASVLWSDRLDSVQSLNEVKNALAEVQTALDAGRPDDAREALMRATVGLGHVDDLDMPASIPATVQKLWDDVIPEAERRSTESAAAAADPTSAQLAGGPSSVSTAPGTPTATTPLLGTILEAIIASNQPQVSTDSSDTPSDGSSAPVVAVGPPTVAGSSVPDPVVDPSPDSSIDPATDVTTESASPTPTPPPVTTEPAPETAPAVPPDPTTETTSSSDPTSTENSAPAPPPPSTEPGTDAPFTSPTSTPAGSSDNSDPAVAGADLQAVDPAAATP